MNVSSTQPLSSPWAGEADIKASYRLFVGREPLEVEIQLHQGRRVDVLLEILASSQEHVINVLEPLRAGGPFPGDRFMSPPEQADVDWLSALAGKSLQGSPSEMSWRALLRRARSHMGLEEVAKTSLPERFDHSGTDRDDVERAFRLILGRAADEPALEAYSRSPMDHLLSALLASDEFRLNILPTIYQGGLDRFSEPVPTGTLEWLRHHLALQLDLGSTRSSVLSAVLQAPLIADNLAHAALSWSSDAVATLLQTEASVEADLRERSRPKLIEEIQRRSVGVEITRVQDMELGDAGSVRISSDDPAIFFRLADGREQAIAVELTFIIAGLRRRAGGALYLDFEEGFSEDASVRLAPRGRRVYHALAMHASRLRGLRWDPDHEPGETSIPSITARALQPQELERNLALLSRSELAGVGTPSRAEADAALTQLLTQRLFGHQPGADYAEWIAHNEPDPAIAQARWALELAQLRSRPRIAILTPLFNTPDRLLREMFESVLNQVYPDWELCLADDASTRPHVRAIVEEYMAHDPRIKAVFRERNGHISEASNSAFELVTADWVALLDHDDVLAPDALLAVAGEIDRYPDVRFIYSDEDKLDLSGRRHDVFFKPDFAPELLRSQNYFNHLSVHRADAIRAVGGWRKGFEGSQDYDLNLRIVEHLERAQVRHIPRVLYHWREVEGSTALGIAEKTYAVEAGLKALSEHVQRKGWDAVVGMIPDLPFYRIRYRVPTPAPRVSVIIPTRDRPDLLATCLDSVLQKTDYPAFEVIIADNGSSDPATFALFERLMADGRVRVVDATGPFNYSRINNDAVRESEGELVCLLNNDVEVITPDWLTEMAGWALQPRIGCVGAKLYFANDTLQHGGVVLGIGGAAGHAFKRFPRRHHGYFSRLALAHNVSAVTAACLVIRRQIWDEVDGLDEALPIAFNDVDLCLRVSQAGYSNVFTPFAELYHYESLSRGPEDNPEKMARLKREVAMMTEKWGDMLTRDPFYSPHLTLVAEDYSIGVG